MMIEPVNMKTGPILVAQPGWFLVGIDQIEDRFIARVLPIGAWQPAAETYPDGEVYTELEPLVPSNRAVLQKPPIDWYWGVFAPGENPLPWAEDFERECEVKLSEWDISNWMPSAAPVFAAADEVLWTDDFAPDDGIGDE